MFAAISPLLRELIADGAAEGVFHPADVDLAAEALLWLGEGRRAHVAEAMAIAAAGDIDRATAMIVKRGKAEEAMADRLLGVPTGSIDFIGSEDFIRGLVAGWGEAERG